MPKIEPEKIMTLCLFISKMAAHQLFLQTTETPGLSPGGSQRKGVGRALVELYIKLKSLILKWSTTLHTRPQ